MRSRRDQEKAWKMFFWLFFGIVAMLVLNFRWPYGIGEWIDLFIFVSATLCFFVLWRMTRRGKLPAITSSVFPEEKKGATR